VRGRRLRSGLVTVAAAVGLLVVVAGFGGVGSLELALWLVLTTLVVVVVDRGDRVDRRRS
jgi:hypothetical protein